MRFLVFVVLPLLVLGCGRGPTAPTSESPAPADKRAMSFAATSSWTRDIEILPPGDDKWYASCVDDSFDEVGSVQLSHHTVTNASGALFFIKLDVLDYYAVGDKTGTWHLVLPNQGGVSVEQIRDTKATYTFSYTLRPFILVNDQTGMTINAPLKLKVTINANGSMVVDRVSEPCHLLGNE